MQGHWITWFSITRAIYYCYLTPSSLEYRMENMWYIPRLNPLPNFDTTIVYFYASIYSLFARRLQIMQQSKFLPKFWGSAILNKMRVQKLSTFFFFCSFSFGLSFCEIRYGLWSSNNFGYAFDCWWSYSPLVCDL